MKPRLTPIRNKLAMENNGLREARLIVTAPRDLKTNTVLLLIDIRGLLLAQFGGYTETQGQGGWVGKKGAAADPIVIFDVAMEPTLVNAANLRTVAELIHGRTGQDCVYVRQANGLVEFVGEG